EAYQAYGEMLHYYAIKNLLEYMKKSQDIGISVLSEKLGCDRETEWVNIGGQIVKKKDADRLRSDVNNNKLNTWKEIHLRYDELWNQYPLEKQRHALATLCDLLETKKISKQQWMAALDKAVQIQEYISEQVYISRKKDYTNPFHQATFRNKDEMIATVGTIEDNSFIRQVREETAQFKESVHDIMKKMK
ncbi:DUF4954 family protein, partial [bacterium]|nr:DUF4954 family protein [bacterium]